MLVLFWWSRQYQFFRQNSSFQKWLIIYSTKCKVFLVYLKTGGVLAWVRPIFLGLILSALVNSIPRWGSPILRKNNFSIGSRFKNFVSNAWTPLYRNKQFEGKNKLMSLLKSKNQLFCTLILILVWKLIILYKHHLLNTKY